MSDKQKNSHLPSEVWVDLVKSKQRENMWWRMLCMSLSVVVLVLVFALVYLSDRNAIKPYVVPVDGLDKEIRAFIQLKPLREEKQIRAVIIEFIRKYVIDFRAIIPDYDTLKANIEFIKQSTDRAVLHSTIMPIYQSENPYELSERISRSVHVNSILPQQGNVYIVTWTETTRNKAGEILEVHEYIAFMTVQVHPPKTLADIKPYNPLGIDIIAIRYEEKK